MADQIFYTSLKVTPVKVEEYVGINYGFKNFDKSLTHPIQDTFHSAKVFLSSAIKVTDEVRRI